MNFKSMQKTAAMFMALFGLNKMPVKDNKVAFSDDQKAQLEEKFGKEITEKAIEAMNKEIEQIKAQESEQSEIDAIQAELDTVLEENGLSDDDALKIHSKGKSGAKTETQSRIVQLVQKLVEQNKDMDAKIQKLIQEPEPDGGQKINLPENGIEGIHDGKFLFESKNDWNKIAGRPWNENLARVAAGKQPKLTDFASDVQVDKLNGDLELFYRFQS